MNQDQELINGILRLIEERTTLLSKEIFNIKEAADYMGLSKHTLHQYCSQKKIPYSKPEGRLVYFLRSDLDAFMTRGRVESNEGVQQIAIRRLA